MAVDSVDGSAWLGMGNSIVRLSPDGNVLSQTNGFWIPQGIAVDPGDRSVWACDTRHNQVVHLSLDGSEIARRDVSAQPLTISINPTDGSIWVSALAGPFLGQVLHMSKEGVELSRSAGFSWEASGGQYVAVDSSDDSCLVADAWHQRMVRLNAAGSVVWQQATGTYSRPMAVAANPADGSFWVGGARFDEVSHFSREGVELWHGLNLNLPSSLAVSPADGSCWVGGQAAFSVVHVAADGALLWQEDGINASLALNPGDGSCWAASWQEAVVVHFAADGTELLRLATPDATRAIAANEADGSCWVALGQRVAHLAPEGTELWRSNSFSMINDLAVNQRDGSLWMAEGDWVGGHVIHFAEDGGELWRGENFRAPFTVSLNLSDGSVWVADQPANALVHLASDGSELYRGQFLMVSDVAVNSRDGSVWVSYDYGFVHLAADGSLLPSPVAYSTEEIAVDPRDGSYWATDDYGLRLRHAASDGTLLGHWDVPGPANSIAINSVNGTVWVSGTEADYLSHFGPDGALLWQCAGLSGEVAASPRDSTVWVSQGWPAQVVHLRVPWFPDLPLDYWAGEAIGACAVAGLVGGYPDASYRPALSVTRDQMAVFIARALSGGDAAVPSGPADATFPDVPTNHWAFKYVEDCHDEAVVQGYWDGYHPDEVVNRAQMAVYVARALVAPSGDAAIPDSVPPPTFPDVPATYWAYKWIEYCHAQGVVQGYWDGYHPEEVVNRAQMAVYVQRAFQLPI